MMTLKEFTLLFPFAFKLPCQGMVFDLEKGSTLYIDLAKSNSRSKRIRAGISYLQSIVYHMLVS